MLWWGGRSVRLTEKVNVFELPCILSSFEPLVTGDWMYMFSHWMVLHTLSLLHRRKGAQISDYTWFRENHNGSQCDGHSVFVVHGKPCGTQHRSLAGGSSHVQRLRSRVPEISGRAPGFFSTFLGSLNLLSVGSSRDAGTPDSDHQHISQWELVPFQPHTRLIKGISWELSSMYVSACFWFYTRCTSALLEHKDFLTSHIATLIAFGLFEKSDESPVPLTIPDPLLQLLPSISHRRKLPSWCSRILYPELLGVPNFHLYTCCY